MKKILLLGSSLQSRNRGINSITKGEILLILNKYGINSNIRILNLGNRSRVHKINYKGETILLREISCTRKELVKAYFNSVTFGRTKIIDEIIDVDYVWDVSKGDNFNFANGIKPFIRECLFKKIVINKKVPLILMPQKIGPFKNYFAKRIVKGIIEKSYKIFVRDIKSKDLIKFELGTSKEIEVSTDLSFYMESDNKTSIERYFKENDKNIIGININAALYNNQEVEVGDNFKRIINKLIEGFITKYNCEILLVPHVDSEDNGLEDDFKVCRELAYELTRKFPKDVRTIGLDYKTEEIKSLISQCSFFIGSRFYPCIDAISSKVPTAYLAYNKDYIHMFNYLNLDECICDISNKISDNMIKDIFIKYEEREKTIEKLNLIVPTIKNNIEKSLLSIAHPS